MAATGEISSVVIRPDNKLLFLPYPSADTTINFEFWKRVKTLTAKTDQLDIPDDVIECLYDRARMFIYADNESPVYMAAEEDFNASYEQLLLAYWPGHGEQSMAEDQDIVVVPV